MTDLGPRVFVTQQPRPNAQNWCPDLAPATEFGTLHYVFGGSEKAYSDPDGALSKALQRLCTFRPERDYILWPGASDPAAVWAVMLALSRLSHVQSIRILYWERKRVEGRRSKGEGFYVPITFNLPFKFFTSNKGETVNGQGSTNPPRG